MLHVEPVPPPAANDYQPASLNDPAPPVPADRESSASWPALSQVSILVVDDENVIRRVVSAHLQQRGFLVMSAADGTEAMAALAVRKFDILVTDLSMPRMDGHALLLAVQDQYPLMRRIVMTGFTTIENALDALKLGAVGFVPKPVDPAALNATVDLAVAELRGWMTQLASIRKLRKRES